VKGKRKKCVSVKFWVFGKKRMEIERKVPNVKKNQSVFQFKIKVRDFLLGSYPLVGRYVVEHGKS
jgi:hypothetical protein